MYFQNDPSGAIRGQFQHYSLTCWGTYTYNGKSQLAKRVLTNLGPDNGTTEFVHDQNGNVIAEADATGQSLREYIWLPEAGYAGTDLPLATVDGVATTPVLYHVHTDHISRPVLMTDSSKAHVWTAIWGPFGQAHSITGTAANNLRFPGQWYQLEAGLHYNWHRHYDPSLGRYTQPDPLGFIDGPSVYAYAGSDPLFYVDPEGLTTARPARRGAGNRGGNYNSLGQQRLDYGPGGRGYTYNQNGQLTPLPRGGVYTLRDAEGNVCRVGRTNDFNRREREHRREFPDLRFSRDRPTDNYNQQRGYEEILYRNFNPPLNLIRPISPRNRNRKKYLRSVE